MKDLAKLAGILLGLVFVAGGLFFFTYLGVLLWAPYETALSDPTDKLILARLDSIHPCSFILSRRVHPLDKIISFF